LVTHGHDGGIDGFISSYRYMPEQNWGYVILLNSGNSRQALQSLNRLAIDFLSKDFLRPQQPVAALPRRVEKVHGYYAPRAPRSQLFAFMDDLKGGTRIRVINGKLTRSALFGQPEPLLYVGKNLFRGEKTRKERRFFSPRKLAIGQSLAADLTTFRTASGAAWHCLFFASRCSHFVCLSCSLRCRTRSFGFS